MKGCLGAVGFVVLLALVASVVMAIEAPGALQFEPVLERQDEFPSPILCVGGFVVVVLGILAVSGGFSLSAGRAMDGFVTALLAIALIVALLAVYVALTDGVSW